MFKVFTIQIDEIVNKLIGVFLCPNKPILNSRCKIKRTPTIKFGRIHLTNLILRTTLATVYSGNNKRFRMESVTVQFTRIGQLKDTLTDFNDSTIHFIQKEENGIIARRLEPIRRIPLGRITRDHRQPYKITLGHLGCTAFNNGKIPFRCNLIHDLRLANTMTTAKKKRQLVIQNSLGNTEESIEIELHCFLSCLLFVF